MSRYAATVTDAPVRPGRPRSEDARLAVLRAVDDLLVESGYAAMTMKGIAEAAGVGRQTVYRWWSTKAEILFEACATDAARELAPPRAPTTAAGVEAYLVAHVAVLERFLHSSDAGASYLALLGEAQHDVDVAALLAGADPVVANLTTVLAPVRDLLDAVPEQSVAAGQLIGPSLVRALSRGATLTRAAQRAHVRGLVRAWGAQGR